MGAFTKKKEVKEVETVVEKLDDVLDTTKPEPVVDTTSPVEPDVIVVESVKDVKPVVRPRKVSKKVVLQIGETGITDLRIPFGFNTTWGEDKVVTQRIAPNTRIEVSIPNECDLNKWVMYYKQLSTIGVRVIQFGTFEEA